VCVLTVSSEVSWTRHSERDEWSVATGTVLFGRAFPAAGVPRIVNRLVDWKGGYGACMVRGGNWNGGRPDGEAASVLQRRRGPAAGTRKRGDAVGNVIASTAPDGSGSHP